MEALATNILNNLFHILWISSIVAEPRYSRKTTVGIVAGTTLVYQAAAFAALYLQTLGILPGDPLSLTRNYFLVYLFGIFLYGCVYCRVLCAAHLLKSLFLLSGYFSCWALIYGLTAILTGTYVGAGGWPVWTLRVVFNLVLYIPYRLFVQKPLFEACKQITDGYGLITTVSLLCFFLQSVLLICNDRLRSRDPVFITLVLSMFVFMVGVYVMIFRYLSQVQATGRARQLQANEKFLRAQMAGYEKMAEQTRRVRHDIRHHCMVVAEYARAHDCDGILEYLRMQDVTSWENLDPALTANRAADTVLTAYRTRCIEQGIEFRADVTLGQTPQITDYDLVTVLANILENALNGCLAAGGERWLSIRIHQKDGKIVIVCKNPCAGNVVFRDGIPQNPRGDGVGAGSISAAAARYGGAADFSAADGVFTCRAVLGERRVK